MTTSSRTHDTHPGDRKVPTRRRLWRLAAVVALLLLGASCGDDDEASEGGAGTEEPAADAGTESGDTDVDADADDGESGGAGDDDSVTADVAAFCDGAIEGEALFNAGPPLDETGAPTPEGLEEFGAQLRPAVDAFEENAPEAVASEVETVVTAIRGALETGDDSAMGSPEVMAADAAVDDYVFENCELDATEDVTALDYAYQGMPATVASGRVGIRLDNEGEEVHEAVVLRLADDTDMTIHEVLELPEEEGMQVAELRGVVFAGPGERGSAVMELDPGRYALVCFIPVGSTSMEEMPQGPGQGGPPHFMEGMVTPFEVS